MENATLYTQVRPAGGELTSVLVRDGRIQALGGAAPAGVPVVDGGGALLLPGLIDAHAHLDKTMYGMPCAWASTRIGSRRGRS
ncbi:hypothetical protein G6F65_016556 [Rhizopus arrhizus]|nr:hypothetical protein G6F31_019407 [Rhizopus arrhizus]KAG1255885.1 hypothetical protein G6F65_016556 [Rhizopus arrhizus]